MFFFMKDEGKSRMKAVQRFNYHVMGGAAYFSVRSMGIRSDVIQSLVELHTRRLSSDQAYVDYAIDFCASKANRLIYKD
jgi:hypothetical protein